MGGPDEYGRLKEYLATDEPNSQGWYDAFCPLHEDNTRSAGFNFTKGIWNCKKGCGQGQISDLIRQLDAREEIEKPQAEVIGLASRRRRQNRPVPSDETIEGWALRLRHDADRLSAFKVKRGLTLETIAHFGIGWSDDDNAYTVPIRSATGRLLNIRLYRIESQGTKIWSYGSIGMDASAIYPEEVLLENSTIVIAEGEWDAMMLWQHGIAAVTGTTGALQWQRKWNQKFKGKDVYFAYDRDKAGVAGAAKAARALAPVARSICIIELPLVSRETHGLDVSDYFNDGFTAVDFKELMRNARVVLAASDGDPIEVSVKESNNSKLVGVTLGMTVSIVGKSEVHGTIAEEVLFACSINAEDKCVGCPMNEAGGNMTIHIAPEDRLLLKLRDVTDAVRNEELRKFIGSSKCGKMETIIKNWHSTELLLCRTSLDFVERGIGDTTQRTVFNVGGYNTEVNRAARIVGTTYADPKDQRSVFQSWKVEPVESSLDSYEIGTDLEMLKMFRPRRGQVPLNKMLEIARDMQHNVTGIIGRLDLHIAMDLVWHSLISFDFDGQAIDKGWLELLVIGDSRTGKSEIATKLARHYGLGKVVSCESVSIPGILGAVKPLPGEKGWVLEWGLIPLNDRRLVVLDEVAGLTTNQIGQLSSLRSTGIAEVHKVVSHVTFARTRMVWLSNPRNNIAGMADFMYGVNAIQPLIGSQEDIARFDFAMTVASGDVSLRAINRHQTSLPHIYSSTATHALLRWIWSRKREDVVWEAGVERLVYDEALNLGEMYVPDPPLIQGQNIRMKLARLAVAIAARVFSSDTTHTKVVVKQIHVTEAVRFLNWIYGVDSFGYRSISEQITKDSKQATAFSEEVAEYIKNRYGFVRFLKSSQGQFAVQTMKEQLNMADDEAYMVIQHLASRFMIRSVDRLYHIMPHLNEILKKIGDTE